MKLEDPRFNREFSAYATDQVEARYVLTPSMMERLVALKSKFGAIGISFIQDRMYLAAGLNYHLFRARPESSADRIAASGKPAGEPGADHGHRHRPRPEYEDMDQSGASGPKGLAHSITAGQCRLPSDAENGARSWPGRNRTRGVPAHAVRQASNSRFPEPESDRSAIPQQGRAHEANEDHHEKRESIEHEDQRIRRHGGGRDGVVGRGRRLGRGIEPECRADRPVESGGGSLGEQAGYIVLCQKEPACGMALFQVWEKNGGEVPVSRYAPRPEQIRRCSRVPIWARR